jgi:hypothetical protein
MLGNDMNIRAKMRTGKIDFSPGPAHHANLAQNPQT